MTTIDSFAGVPAPLATALRRRGFEQLTPVQRAVLEAACDGRDLRISSQTGSGKTVALGLALARDLVGAPVRDGAGGPAALVIVPTRELAAQVRDELDWLFADVPALRVEVVTGGTDLHRERKRLAQKPTLVVGTPGRLLDHVRSGALDCARVEHVVLDEADQMFDMGFREELDAIVDALPSERRSHLLSATFPAAVRQLANRFQRDALRIEGTRHGAANEDIEHVAYLVRPNDRYAALVNLLLMTDGGRVLVFVRRRVDTAELAERLAADGFAALPLSGDLAQGQRTRTLAAFRSGSVPILVSTDVAARGIDVPEVDTVIHMEPPSDAEMYTHRSGRTGRAGRKGRSLLLVPPFVRRRVEVALHAARVRFDWHPAPSPDAVRKAVEKRGRRRVHALLDAATPPSDAQLDFARKLLEGRDPAAVVAALAPLAAPSLPLEPLPLEVLLVHRDAPREPRPHARAGHARPHPHASRSHPRARRGADTRPR
jgi:ATP-dependent RNA helicase DeaD